jgi:ribosomal protein S15P/S13E
MDGPNIRRHQPRPWYMGAGDKFIAKYRRHMEEQFTVLGDQIKALTTQLSNMGGHNGNGSGDPSAERGMHRHQHRAQAHANQWENGFKLNIPEFQGWLQPEEFLVTKEIEKINKNNVLREAAEIRSQLVEEEGDGFIEEDCLVDWASPPIYDTYPDEEVSSIHQVDFLGVDAILSKTFNQSCDEIYGAETTFLSKSEGVFVSSLGILMAYRNYKAQEKHNKSTWQSGVWGFHDKHQSMSMIKNVTFIMGCGVAILRSGEWNKLTGHLKDRGKDSPNLKANSLQLGEDDVDQDGLSYLLVFYLN